MVKINRKVEYALMVLKHVAARGPGELSTAREVCDLYQTPFDTTAKVMQQLNAAGILGSTKGVKGGYHLTRKLSEVSYLELVELVEGRPFAMDCHEGPCELLGSCNISTPIKRLNHYLSDVFTRLSVDQLLGGKLPEARP